jgi:transposase-like protein
LVPVEQLFKVGISTSRVPSGAFVGISWRLDETYVKVRGEWMYLYRAVDKRWENR